MDYEEINGADVRGIEAMRELTPGMFVYPGQLKKRIYILDEAQQITPAAQELLNKVLEEPAPDTMIVLCTTNKQGLKRTLLGRCSKLNFRRISKEDSKTIIAQVIEDAGLPMPDLPIVDDVFMRADGSVRDLLNLLEKVVLDTYVIGSDTADSSVNEGSPDIFKLVKGYIDKDWDTIRQILMTENVKNDPDGYRETVCAFLARDALKFPELKMSIATALGHLAGSMWEQPKREQHSMFVLRSMRCCYRKDR